MKNIPVWPTNKGNCYSTDWHHPNRNYGWKDHPKSDILWMSFEQGKRIQVKATCSYQFLSLLVLNTVFQQQNWYKENFITYCQFHLIIFLSRIFWTLEKAFISKVDNSWFFAYCWHTQGFVHNLIISVTNLFALGVPIHFYTKIISFLLPIHLTLKLKPVHKAVFKHDWPKECWLM